MLLLDEPFSQLDAALRAEMRLLVRDLHTATGMTTLFVTHDQAEAVEVADEIALMFHGRLEGIAPAAVFYTDPPSLSAARFFGVTNELVGEIRGGVFRCADAAVPTAAADGPATLVVRPEALEVVAAPSRESLTGTAVTLRFAGTHQLLDIRLTSGDVLTAQVPLGHPAVLGSPVHVRVPAERVSYFPGGHG